MGGPGPTAKKQSGQRFLFVCFFLSSIYFKVYRGGPMVLLQRKLYFSKDPEWAQHFTGGGPTFSRGGGGPNANFYRNTYNL